MENCTLVLLLILMLANSSALVKSKVLDVASILSVKYVMGSKLY